MVRKGRDITSPHPGAGGGSRRRTASGRTAAALVALVVLVVLGSPGSPRAQMQLPGTTSGGAGGAGGTGGSSAAPSAYAPPKPIILEAPGEASVAGHPLGRDGNKGEMLLDRAGADKPGADKDGAGKEGADRAAGLVLAKLTLSGDKISKPGQSCTVDATPASPLPLVAAGRPAGALRYGVPLPACPFSIDVLDGAVLATSAAASCDFTAADCRASVGGLWGPRAADISAKRAKELEREHRRLETTMLTNFRALLRKAGKDKAAVKSVAREQAAFSSEREMTCRDYDGETVHGFCSTQVTQARALSLMAQFGPVGEGRKHAARSRPRPSERPAAAEAVDPSSPQ